MLASVARTQAVYYRDARGNEPVDEFIEALPAKRAAKIDDHVEEHLTGGRRTRRRPSFRSPRRLKIELAKRRMADFKRRMDAGRHVPPRAVGDDAPRQSREGQDIFIIIDTCLPPERQDQQSCKP
jgi:hypothetical protein